MGLSIREMCTSFFACICFCCLLLLMAMLLLFWFSSFLFLIFPFLLRLHKCCLCVHNFVSCRDLNKVDEGIGHKIGMLLQAITTVLVGFIMGFVYGWKLTLVMIAASPLVVIAGGIIAKVIS